MSSCKFLSFSKEQRHVTHCKLRDTFSKQIDHTNESGYGFGVIGSRKSDIIFDIFGVNLYTVRCGKFFHHLPFPQRYLHSDNLTSRLPE